MQSYIKERKNMKLQKIVFPLFALAVLASCGGGNSSASSSMPASSESSAQENSSQSLPTFEAFTLSELHDARVAKTLPTLNEKYVAVKGKVTFAKHSGEDDGELVIQSGKYAVEVSYPDVFNVNVGDSVEVKGRFHEFKVGDVSTISISTYRSVVPNSEIKVIDEAISTETVTISKEADLVEYDSSLSSIDFDVVGAHRNSSYLVKLSQGDTQFILANKLSVAEKLPEGTFAAGDKVNYSGIFTYTGNEETKVIRYFDEKGFTKAAPATLSAVYFKDAEWWAQDSARSGIYLWKDENKNVNWPGEAMESLGNGIWKYTFDPTKDYASLIFTRIGPNDLSDYGAKTIEITIADIDAATPLYDISAVTSPIWGDPGVTGQWVAYQA